MLMDLVNTHSDTCSSPCIGYKVFLKRLIRGWYYEHETCGTSPPGSSVNSNLPLLSVNLKIRQEVVDLFEDCAVIGGAMCTRLKNRRA